VLGLAGFLACKARATSAASALRVLRNTVSAGDGRLAPASALRCRRSEVCCRLVVVRFGAMAQALARYDEFAAWYEQWIADARPLIASHPGLVPAVAGEQVLDMACGQGRMSRHLAGLGA
jgi:2-polyprenyl-3-methyl-5-hydroxy-6-metoxy-1,4-benzoquinol methylase